MTDNIYVLFSKCMRDGQLVVGGGPLQLDEVVVSAVGGEEGAGVLEVLAVGVALERLHHRLVVPSWSDLQCTPLYFGGPRFESTWSHSKMREIAYSRSNK